MRPDNENPLGENHAGFLRSDVWFLTPVIVKRQPLLEHTAFGCLAPNNRERFRVFIDTLIVSRQT